MKRTFLLLLYLLGGVLLGTLLSEVGSKVDFLHWLCLGKTIGIDSLSVNLAVLQFSFSIHLGLDISMLLCITAAVILYAKTSKYIH